MKPLVGMLYNRVAPSIIDYAPELVEYVEVIPERLWYDFGPSETGFPRFRRVHGAIEELKRAADGRVVAGHGIGLWLPRALPIDLAQVDQVSSFARELDFQWYSEHLGVSMAPKVSVPNS